MPDSDFDLIGGIVFIVSGVLPAVEAALMVAGAAWVFHRLRIPFTAWVRAVAFVLLTVVLSPIAALVPDWTGETAITLCKGVLAVDAQNRSVPDIEETKDIRPGNNLAWMKPRCEIHLKEKGQAIPGRPVSVTRTFTPTPTQQTFAGENQIMKNPHYAGLPSAKVGP